ncbi:hypothetical protein F5Y07DRAFT_404207 [Xylaria sp. FL0933]|nr:hypothetical protein F5Y07DRAFT_404207 [Xylaria sp. FL0933]
MDSIAEIRERLLGAFAPDDYENQLEKRCHSAPPITRERWVAKQKEYVPFEKPTRSVSVISRVRSDEKKPLLAREFRPIPFDTDSLTPITEEFGSSIMSQEDGGYDSDAEDRRNGVPTTYSQNQLRVFRQERKVEVEKEFKALEVYDEQLSQSLCELEAEYMQFRREFVTFDVDWTAARWQQFLTLEDVYFALQDEAFDVQNQMQHKSAQMLLFMDGPCGGVRYEDEETGIDVWSLEGAAESRVREGEYITPTWNGVEYPALG